ncbi:STAS domain-containing protein [Phytohabitans kaempferiae]|uniref:STAS domain-containing protein n=1 Tax=Phytohabitans kaempferiae TaxID=1620943 RepID=A0ABV6MH78_9ACTN
MLTITETARNGAARLVLAGDLDMATCPDLIVAVEKARDVTKIVLDCVDLDFCDATGVSALLEARAAAHDAGVELRLVNVHGLPRKVLEICEVLPLLTDGGPD